jgi:hypothetical protein
MDDVSEPSISVGEEARQRDLENDLRALVGHGLAYARTEAELQKARAVYAAGKVGSIALFGTLAAVLAFFALVALTVGLVIALAPLLTAFGATGAVFGGLLVVAGFCALVALRKWKRMITALSNPEGE